MVVLAAGALQFTAWKTRHLACYREAPGQGHAVPADAGTVWRYGLRLGVHCSACGAGLTAILLVAGLMDLRAMAIMTTAVTLERLTLGGGSIARGIGALLLGAGLVLIVRAGALA